MAKVVLDHHLDEDAGVYRLVVGVAVVADTEERVVDHVDVEDFVFSADDSRWFDTNGKRRALKDVAAKQRALVRDALTARDAEVAGAPAQPVRSLPGIGAPLDE